MSDYTQIRLDVDDGIATITLHRPDKMNAFSRTMMGEIIDALSADHQSRLLADVGAEG